MAKDPNRLIHEISKSLKIQYPLLTGPALGPLDLSGSAIPRKFTSEIVLN